MANHLTGVPDSGVRQVNVRYVAANSEFAEIERLRELTPFKTLNKVMLRALLLGARELLATLHPNEVIKTAIGSDVQRPVQTIAADPVKQFLDEVAPAVDITKPVIKKTVAEVKAEAVANLIKPAEAHSQTPSGTPGFSPAARKHLDSW